MDPNRTPANGNKNEPQQNTSLPSNSDSSVAAAARPPLHHHQVTQSDGGNQTYIQYTEPIGHASGAMPHLHHYQFSQSVGGNQTYIQYTEPIGHASGASPHSHHHQFTQFNGGNQYTMPNEYGTPLPFSPNTAWAAGPIPHLQQHQFTQFNGGYQYTRPNDYGTPLPFYPNTAWAAAPGPHLPQHQFTQFNGEYQYTRPSDQGTYFTFYPNSSVAAATGPYLDYHQFTQSNGDNQYTEPIGHAHGSSNLAYNGRVTSETQSANGLDNSGATTREEMNEDSEWASYMSPHQVTPPANELLVPDSSDRIPRENFLKYINQSCLTGIQIVSHNYDRPCFRNLVNLRARTRSDITPDGTVTNIKSQGNSWVTKDFIEAFIRLTNCWYVLKEVVEHNEAFSKEQMKKKMGQKFVSSFHEWEYETIKMTRQIVNTFYKLHTEINTIYAETAVYAAYEKIGREDKSEETAFKPHANGNMFVASEVSRNHLTNGSRLNQENLGGDVSEIFPGHISTNGGECPSEVVPNSMIYGNSGYNNNSTLTEEGAAAAAPIHTNGVQEFVFLETARNVDKHPLGWEGAMSQPQQSIPAVTKMEMEHGYLLNPYELTEGGLTEAAQCVLEILVNGLRQFVAAPPPARSALYLENVLWKIKNLQYLYVNEVVRDLRCITKIWDEIENHTWFSAQFDKLLMQHLAPFDFSSIQGAMDEIVGPLIEKYFTSSFDNNFFQF